MRKETNTTQDDLASKLFVTRQAISKWESGDATPDLANLIKLTDIFNVSLDALVFASEQNDSKVDPTQFTFDPRRNRYVRKFGQMNFWDFVTSYWWAILLVIYLIGWFPTLWGH